MSTCGITVQEEIEESLVVLCHMTRLSEDEAVRIIGDPALLCWVYRGGRRFADCKFKGLRPTRRP